MNNGMFDLNGDGKMSASERAYEHYVYDSINKNSNSSSLGGSASGKKQSGVTFGGLLLFFWVISLFVPSLDGPLGLVLLGYLFFKWLYGWGVYVGLYKKISCYVSSFCFKGIAGNVQGNIYVFG